MLVSVALTLINPQKPIISYLIRVLWTFLRLLHVISVISFYPPKQKQFHDTFFKQKTKPNTRYIQFIEKHKKIYWFFFLFKSNSYSWRMVNRKIFQYMTFARNFTKPFLKSAALITDQFSWFCTYLWSDLFMLMAGDRHHVGPISRCHDYSGDLGTGDVEGRCTVLIRALDAGAAVLTSNLSMAEHTLLQRKQIKSFCYVSIPL